MMKAVASALVLVLMLAVSAAIEAADAPPPAASEPTTTSVVRTSPSGKSVEQARSPNQTQSSQPIVPQITVPLKNTDDGSKSVRTRKNRAVESSIDDSAARCLAAASPQERARCEGGAAAAPAAKSSGTAGSR